MRGEMTVLTPGQVGQYIKNFMEIINRLGKLLKWIKGI